MSIISVVISIIKHSNFINLFFNASCKHASFLRCVCYVIRKICFQLWSIAFGILLSVTCDVATNLTGVKGLISDALARQPLHHYYMTITTNIRYWTHLSLARKVYKLQILKLKCFFFGYMYIFQMFW